MPARDRLPLFSSLKQRFKRAQEWRGRSQRGMEFNINSIRNFERYLWKADFP